MSTVKKKVLQYSITTGVCSVLVFLLLWARGIFKNPTAVQLYQYLTDSFFIVGILVAMIGLLIFVSNGGVFDMLVYGIYRFITLFKKDHTNVKYNTFYDYRVAKAERPKASFLFLIIVGVVFLAVSMIFLIFWYNNQAQ